MLKSKEIASADLEKSVISGVLNNPDVIYDIDFLEVEDFYSHEYHRAIWSVVKDFHKNGQELNKLLIAQRITALKLDARAEFKAADYLDALFYLPDAKTADSTRKYSAELKKISMRRHIIEASEQVISEMVSGAEGKTYDEIQELADKTFNHNIDFYDYTQEFEDIYEDLEEKMEFLGDTQPEPQGFYGPFKRYNELYGPYRPGSITVTGARSGGSKTTSGMFICTNIAKNYGVPILHLDHGEMSKEELQFRVVCMLSGGKIPFHAVESGKWKSNEEFRKIMINDVFATIKKYNLKNYYRDISHKTGREAVSMIRRFYYKNIGRGNPFFTHLDYLKPFDGEDPNTPEWKAMGSFVQSIKSLYSNEMKTQFYTSLQLNRSGITKNKNSASVDDSENTFGISDRIVQQSTHSFILREMLLDEVAVEGGDANAKMICVKHRHLGEKAEDAIKYVKMPDNTYRKNHIRLDIKNFHIEERGDLKQYVTAHRDDILLAQGGEIFSEEDGSIEF